jgi:hypothetical protein
VKIPVTRSSGGAEAGGYANPVPAVYKLVKKSGKLIEHWVVAACSALKQTTGKRSREPKVLRTGKDRE